jgi:cytochrome c
LIVNQFDSSSSRGRLTFSIDGGIPLKIASLALAVGCVGVAIVGSATAGEFATKDEAQAIVKKATSFIKEQGAAAAYPEISNRGGKFVDRDLYVVVYGLDGKVLAHGANAKLVGKEMIDAQDVDGKPFVKERVELGRKQASFWQDYKFVNPTTKKVEPKQMYCERMDETVVCAGVYKL